MSTDAHQHCRLRQSGVPVATDERERSDLEERIRELLAESEALASQLLQARMELMRRSLSASGDAPPAHVERAHQYLDELLAGFLRDQPIGKRLTNSTLMELMLWSSERVKRAEQEALSASDAGPSAPGTPGK